MKKILILILILSSIATAYEDFTTWTEVDPGGHLSQTATRATYTDLPDNAEAYLYKDYGANYFSGDFAHAFDLRVSASSSPSDYFIYMLSLQGNGLSTGNDADINLFVEKVDATTYFIGLGDYAGSTGNQTGNLDMGTTYYLVLKRESTTYTLEVYQDSNRQSLLESISIDPGVATAFQYLYTTGTFDMGGAGDTQSGYIENLDLNYTGGVSGNISSCTPITTSGTYNLTTNLIDEPNTCMNISADNVTFDCKGHVIDGDLGSTDIGIYVSANNVTIRNCTLSNWGYGIHFYNSNNSQIQDISIENGWGEGILIQQSSNTTLSDITVTNTTSLSGKGIVISDSDSITVTNVTLSFHLIGAYVAGSYNCILSNIVANSNTEEGIFLGDSFNTTLYDSYIYDNPTGLIIAYSGNNLIYNNYLVNTENVEFSGTIYANSWNTTKQEGTPITGSGTQIGGNYWGKPDGMGYSDTCIDTDGDYFCDNPYTLHHSIAQIDYLPLSAGPTGGSGGMPPTTTLPRPTLIVTPSPLRIGIPPSEECKTEKLYLTWTGPETVTVTIYPTRELSKNLKIPSRVFVPPDRTVTLPVKGCLSKKLVGCLLTARYPGEIACR